MFATSLGETTMLAPAPRRVRVSVGPVHVRSEPLHIRQTKISGSIDSLHHPYSGFWKSSWQPVWLCLCVRVHVCVPPRSGVSAWFELFGSFNHHQPATLTQVESRASFSMGLALGLCFGINRRQFSLTNHRSNHNRSRRNERADRTGYKLL